MKFDQLSKQDQAKVMIQAKKDYPSAFKKTKHNSLNGKQYQKWLQDQAIKATTNEMFNNQYEVA